MYDGLTEAYESDSLIGEVGGVVDAPVRVTGEHLPNEYVHICSQKASGGHTLRPVGTA